MNDYLKVTQEKPATPIIIHIGTNNPASNKDSNEIAIKTIKQGKNKKELTKQGVYIKLSTKKRKV